MDLIDLSAMDNDDLSGSEEDLAPSKTVRIFMVGSPTPKPSVRVNSKFVGTTKLGKPVVKKWATNPARQKLSSFKELVEKQVKAQSSSQLPVTRKGPVKLTVFFCSKPESFHFVNKDRNRPKGTVKAVQEGRASLPFVAIKPDTDNCVKFVQDGMSKIVWTDDAQVAQIVAHKCLDCHPPHLGRTVIEVTDRMDFVRMPEWSVALK